MVWGEMELRDLKLPTAFRYRFLGVAVPSYQLHQQDFISWQPGYGHRSLDRRRSYRSLSVGRVVCKKRKPHIYWQVFLNTNLVTLGIFPPKCGLYILVSLNPTIFSLNTQPLTWPRPNVEVIMATKLISCMYLYVGSVAKTGSQTYSKLHIRNIQGGAHHLLVSKPLLSIVLKCFDHKPSWTKFCRQWMTILRKTCQIMWCQLASGGWLNN